MLSQALDTITIDAAELAACDFRVCDIGIVPFRHGGEWHLLFGQQTLQGPFVVMVNKITAAIDSAGGVRFDVQSDGRRRAWAALVRLPGGAALSSLRTAVYDALAQVTGRPAIEIARLAATHGESALLDAQPKIAAIGQRVADAVRAEQTSDAPPGRVPQAGEEVLYRHRDDAADAATERIVPAVIERVDDDGRVSLRVFLDHDNFGVPDAVRSDDAPFGWFWPNP